MSPIVLGLCGGTASGKSTLAARVAERLADDCLLILHDRYYISMPDEFQERPTHWNFDDPRSLETTRLIRDLDELRAGRATSIPKYDYRTHSRLPDEESVEPRRVILVEGILVFADEDLRRRMDHRVFVYTPDDIRLIRRIKRDREERNRTALQTIDQYERSVRPMHEKYVAPGRSFATTEVDGTDDVERGVEAVLALL